MREGGHSAEREKKQASPLGLGPLRLSNMCVESAGVLPDSLFMRGGQLNI